MKSRYMATAPAGTFEGRERGGAVAWRGIRYAVADRFALPRPVPVVPGVIQADASGPACPQVEGPVPASQLGAPASEQDCLCLDVCSPAADDRRRPVMVWIHGGAFFIGSGAQYDGATLAASGDMVVVTLNYRLGVLGFLGLEHAGVPDNLGLHDQIAALRWVRDNIAAFGGDPQRVTLAGESAGSMAISLLMVCREADGLYHGAIMESGAANLVLERPMAREIGRRLVAQLGDDGATLERLKALPVERLLAAQQAVASTLVDMIATAPCLDGVLLPASLEEARATKTPPVPLLAGYNRDETRLFELKMFKGVLPVRWASLRRLLRVELGDARSERILESYPEDKAGERALATDMAFAMPTRHFAQRHAAGGAKVWFYRFDLGGPLLGAAHALELIYLWRTPGWRAWLMTGGPMWGRRRALSQRMRGFWSAFVRDGNPGDAWPRFKGPDGKVLLLDRVDSVTDDVDAPRRRAWAGADVPLASGRATQEGAAQAA